MNLKSKFSQIVSLALPLVPPIEACFGVIKRFRNKIKKVPYLGLKGPIGSSDDNSLLADREARILPYTHAFSRGAVIIGSVLLVLGFLGFLAAWSCPIPGVGPLYTAGALAITKAIGIAIGYTTAARTIGAFVGAICDTISGKVLFDNSMSRAAIIRKATLNVGLSQLIVSVIPKSLKFAWSKISRFFIPKNNELSSAVVGAPDNVGTLKNSNNNSGQGTIIQNLSSVRNTQINFTSTTSVVSGQLSTPSVSEQSHPAPMSGPSHAAPVTGPSHAAPDASWYDPYSASMSEKNENGKSRIDSDEEYDRRLINNRNQSKNYSSRSR